MKVTFTKVATRRYSLTAEGTKHGTVKMDPAPGFHDRLPHDAAHLIVEIELGIEGGIFGQIAAGGILPPQDQDARIRRKAKKRREAIFKANNDDALFSEHAVCAAQSRWEKHEMIPETKIPPADLARIIAKFEEFAAQWSLLPIGGSISLEWQDDRAKRKR
jgi:hypothetical protein